MLDQVVFPLSAEKNPLATAGDLGLIPWEDPSYYQLIACFLCGCPCVSIQTKSSRVKEVS